MKEFSNKDLWKNTLSFISVLAPIVAFFIFIENIYNFFNNFFKCEIWAVRTIVILLVVLFFIIWIYTFWDSKRRSKKEKQVAENNEIGLKEIVNYWVDRKKAEDYIKEYFMTTTDTDELLISGIGFGTLENILSDNDIIKHIAKLLSEINTNLKITFIFPINAASRIDLKGKTVSEIEENVKNGHVLISEFIKNVTKSVILSNSEKADFSIERHIILRHYKDNILPRHFIFKGNDTIFVGSYFSYYKGSKSYLLRLKHKRGEGLFNAFKTEAEHILGNSEPISHKNFASL